MKHKRKTRSDKGKPRKNGSNTDPIATKFNEAKVIFATMIIEGQDKSWTPFMREAVKNILF